MFPTLFFSKEYCLECTEQLSPSQIKLRDQFWQDDSYVYIPTHLQTRRTHMYTFQTKIISTPMRCQQLFIHLVASTGFTQMVFFSNLTCSQSQNTRVIFFHYSLADVLHIQAFQWRIKSECHTQPLLPNPTLNLRNYPLVQAHLLNKSLTPWDPLCQFLDTRNDRKLEKIHT